LAQRRGKVREPKLRGTEPRRCAIVPIIGKGRPRLARDPGSYRPGHANLRRPDRRQINRRSQRRLNRANPQRRRQTGLGHDRIRICRLWNHSAQCGHLDRVNLGGDQRPDREQTLGCRKRLWYDRSCYRIDAVRDLTAESRWRRRSESGRNRRMRLRRRCERVWTQTERGTPCADSGADQSRRDRKRRLDGVRALPDHRIRNRRRGVHIWGRHM
jgi:hypothetical protein